MVANQLGIARSARSRREAKMRATNYHLGIGYEVWYGQNSWFWLVISPYQNAGTIGAAVSQDQAACDACLTIEEMTAWPYPQPCSTACAEGQRLQSSNVMIQAKIQWEDTLTRLQHYLSCVTRSRA
jgi:hypothetical protein